MKKTIIIFFTVLEFIGVSAQISQPVDFVNPLIGTDKSSHKTLWESKGATFPGVLMPFGMVQITPNGYTYSDNKISSFSFLNHRSGWGSIGDFNLMAYSGGSLFDFKKGAAFDHKNELALPYLYKVLLKDVGIDVSFTATARVGLGKFIFQKEGPASIVLSDLSKLVIMDSISISGRCNEYYFIAKFSKPFESYVICPGRKNNHSNIGIEESNDTISFNFSTRAKDIILVKIGFSTTSFIGVVDNVRRELPSWDFEQTSLNLKRAWNDKLSQIEVTTPIDSTKSIFYTALYHSMFMPFVISDASSNREAYTPLFPWDTYRSLHPLITLLSPGRESDMVASVISTYDSTGWLPTDNMMGNHNIELMLDSYIKGAGDFDISKASAAICKSLLQHPYARREMADFVKNGFVPASITSSVTHSLEFAYNNWAAAKFLEITGYKNKYPTAFQSFTNRAFWYKNSFDPATCFMRAKTLLGKWTDGGYAEGTDWTYSWYVPHDIQGLINLMGGKKLFSNLLSRCFKEGHYIHDNEPQLHYAYLFNFSGQPWKTQFWSRQIVEGSYSADPGGIPGNDDLGALSSWFVFSALGFYPVTPGTNQYQIGSPVFEKSIVHLANGRQFELLAKNVSKQNKYIQSASLDGILFNRTWLTHQEIVGGKKLILTMGPKPNKEWGSNVTFQPYSITAGKPEFLIGNMQIAERTTKANIPIDFSVAIQNKSRNVGTWSEMLFMDGKPFKKLTAVVSPGEEMIIHEKITLYQQGIHRFQIKGLAILKLEVEKTVPEFLFGELIIPVPHLFNVFDSIPVRVKVKNIGSYKSSRAVNLLVNNIEKDSQIVSLEPGEEKELQYSYLAENPGVCSIGIEKLRPIRINVLNRTGNNDCDYSELSSFKPILILNFDEEKAATIEDFSGNGNNGIVKGDLKWVKGVFGSAIQTNATLGNYVQLPQSKSLAISEQAKELTLMAWVYPMEENNFSDIICDRSWNALQIKGSNHLINFYANGWEGHEAMKEVPENWNRQWHHLVGVTDGIYYRLYVDGKLVETKLGEAYNPNGESSPPVNNESNWNIGRNAGALDRVFNGYIDDVMIFGKALNSEQITDLMIHDF